MMERLDLKDLLVLQDLKETLVFKVRKDNKDPRVLMELME